MVYASEYIQYLLQFFITAYQVQCIVLLERNLHGTFISCNDWYIVW